MKNNNIIMGLLVIAILLLTYLVFFKDVRQVSQFPNYTPSTEQDGNIPTIQPPTTSVPLSVKNKYEEVKKEYANSLGSSLQLCTKGNKMVFVVEGSGGYTGIAYYYNNQGSLIGTKESSDTIQIIDGVSQAPKAPIDIESYSCQTIETSRK